MFATFLVLGLGCRVHPHGPGDDSSGTSPDFPPILGKARHTIVLVMDGSRMDETFGDGTSTVTGGPTADVASKFRQEMFPRGALVMHALNTAITDTTPAHVELLVGQRVPFGHFPSAADNIVTEGIYQPHVPTLLEAFNAAGYPGNMLAGNTVHIPELVGSTDPVMAGKEGTWFFVHEPDDPIKSEENDATVVQAVKDLMIHQKPPFLLVNLHSIDRNGHYSDDPKNYAAEITSASEAIVDLWKWIQDEDGDDAASGFKDQTLLVVTADHGRHRTEAQGCDDAPNDQGFLECDYRSHGDSCAGCREVPMYLVGPNIQPGLVVDGPTIESDLAPTVAAISEVPFPTTQGHVMPVLVDPPDRMSPSGTIRVAASGGLVAEERFNDDLAARSTVLVDGVEMSTTGVMHAEEPVVMRTSKGVDFACWRELSIGAYGSFEVWPWSAKCRSRATATSEWTDIGFPVPEVWPYFSPDMAEGSDGSLWMAFTDNPEAASYQADIASVRMLHWDGATWTGAEYGVNALYPEEPTLLPTSTGAIVAFAASDSVGLDNATAARYTRHIEIEKVTLDEKGIEVWSEGYRNYTLGCENCPPTTATPDSDGTTYYRFESPVVGTRGGQTSVAFYGFDPRGNQLLLVDQATSGGAWSQMHRVDTSNRVFANVRPVWNGETLWWTRASATDTVEVCALAAGGTSPSCQDTGAARVWGLAPSAGGGVWTQTLQSDGSWSRIEVAAP